MKFIFRYGLAVLSTIVVLCSYTKAQNLIDNPGFENGITAWSNNSNNGAIVNFVIETAESPEGTKHLKSEVTKLGINDWDLQLRSNEFAVDESHQYRLTFMAKSSKSESVVKVYIQKSIWMGKTFTLSDTWETYTYEFFPNEPTKQLKFNFVNIDDYYIDGIVMEDITVGNSSFDTPPSCVITAPHTNAYFKKGSSVTINAHSTDLGGSGVPGEISKVEFFINNQKIGETSTAKNNIYTQEWNAENVGEYRIVVIATDTTGNSFASAGVLVLIGTENGKRIGLSAGKGKYIGNVVRNTGVEPTFTNYWNAVTSGNGGKWQTVERNRDVMDWDKADEAYTLASANHLAYRYHTIAWGSQYPSWITTLSPAEFQEEMEEFIKTVANRFPYIDQIDVINEALEGHQEDTKYFIDGLGGDGESGYDWAVWLFKKCREYFPNSKLILNDFGMVNSTNNIRKQFGMLKVLRDSALVDGFGAQAHTFSLDKIQANVLKANLDLMATAGVPIYITEMDMQGKDTNEASQLSGYQNLFPVLWEHPNVAGITLWGYIYGDMWKPDAGLIYKNGTERSCMVWLKNYMNDQPDVGYPFGSVDANYSPETRNKPVVELFPNPSNGNVKLLNPSDESQNVVIYNLLGRIIKSRILKAKSGEVISLPNGMYLAKLNNNETVKLIVQE